MAEGYIVARGGEKSNTSVLSDVLKENHYFYSFNELIDWSLIGQ